MINPNAKIEQLINTGGGVNRHGYGETGAFGDWAYSTGLNDSNVRSEISMMYRLAREGNYLSNQTDLNGNRILAYELMPNKNITLLAESSSERLDKQCDYDDSFIDEPEKAPYRIIAMKLNDGRLAVCRYGFVNKNYGTDNRGGNYFTHTLVFPAGTDVKDIDVNSLKFKIGLDKAYWGRNPKHVKGPTNLPSLSVDEVIIKTTAPQTKAQQAKPQVQPVKTAPTQVNSTDEIDELESCVLQMVNDDMSVADKASYARQFGQMRNSGANIDGLCVKLYQQGSNALIEGDNEIASLAKKAIDKASQNNDYYDTIFGMVDHYYDLEKKIQEAEARGDNDKVDELINQQREYVKNNIQIELPKYDLKKLNEVVSSRRQLLLEEAKFNALEDGVDPASAQAKVRVTDEYKKLQMFERKITTAIDKNKALNL